MPIKDDARSAGPSLGGSGAILLQLNRAVQRATMHPADPSIPSAVSSLMRALEAEWEGRTVISIAVAQHRFIVDEQEINARHGALAWLAKKFTDRGLAAIVLSRRTSDAALTRLAAWLGGADETSEIPHLGGISLTWADYSRMRLGENREAEPAGDPLKAWRMIVERLTADWFQGDVGALPEDPSELASALSAAIERNEGVGSSTLTSRVIAAGMRLSDLSYELRRAVRSRLAAFVARLNPDLRRELLRVDARSSAEKLQLLIELSDSLPNATLMEILADIGETAGRVQREFVTLLDKLVGLSVRDPFLRELTETKLISIGLPRGLTLMESSHVRRVLEQSMLQQPEREWTNPESAAAPDDVVHRRVDVEQRAHLYCDEEPAEIARHVSAILLRLLVGLPEHPDAPRYLKRLREDLPRDLAQSRFASLHEVASSLHDLGRLRNYLPDELPPLIDGYFADLRAPDTVGRLVAAIEAEDGDVPEEIEKLLVLVGAEAGVAALDRMAALSRSPARDRLARLLTLLPAETFATVVARARTAGGAQLDALLEVLALPATPLRLELALTFAGNRDPKVRLAVLRLLVLGDDRPGQAARYLERGLHDPDSAVRRAALELTPQRLGDEAVAFLGGYLRTRVATGDDLQAKRQAILLLQGYGTPPARAALRDCLTSQRFRLGPKAVRLAQSLVEAIERLGGDDEREAVRIWRRSPSGWMGRLLGPRVKER